MIAPPDCPLFRPPVETGGWNFGKSAFADCGVGVGAGWRRSVRLPVSSNTTW
jgi:hypothetical protein